MGAVYAHFHQVEWTSLQDYYWYVCNLSRGRRHERIDQGRRSSQHPARTRKILPWGPVETIELSATLIATRWLIITFLTIEMLRYQWSRDASLMVLKLAQMAISQSGFTTGFIFHLFTTQKELQSLIAGKYTPRLRKKQRRLDQIHKVQPSEWCLKKQPPFVSPHLSQCLWRTVALKRVALLYAVRPYQDPVMRISCPSPLYT